MKNIITFPILLFSLIIQVYGQEYKREYGVLSQAEFDLKYYAKDRSAEALVLYDVGESRFVDDVNTLNVVYSRATRIKVFTDAGVDWAEVEIPIYQKGNVYEKVYDIEATTYNVVDGKLLKSKLDLSTCYNEKLNERWLLKKFVLPNVKPGSIIEYRYKVSSQYHYNLRDWEFQRSIPTLYSKYEVRMVPFYEYTFLLQGASKFDETKSYVDNGLVRQFGHAKFKDVIHEYVMRDIPAFKDEGFITSIDDYILKIDFQLAKYTNLQGTSFDVMTSWSGLISDLLKDQKFGKYISKSNKTADNLFDIETITTKAPIDRFNYVIDYVKDNYKWNEEFYYYATKTPSAFLKDKYGNSSAINLFAIGLLNAAGIEAEPVIISTRNHGKVRPDYPFSHFFNNTIILAQVGNSTILTDATERMIKNDRIPLSCINDIGLQIVKKQEKWIGLEGMFYSAINKNMKISIVDDKIEASIKTKSTEYDAFKDRLKYGDDLNEISSKLSENGYEIVDSSIVVHDFSNFSNPYSLSFNLRTDVEHINNKVYVKPFLNEVIAENPFKQSSRSYDVDMVYKKKRSYTSFVNIPEGYMLEYKPENYKIKNELFEFEYIVLESKGKFIVKLDYEFKKAVYSPQEYKKIKFYYLQIVKKGNEKFVFAQEEK